MTWAASKTLTMSRAITLAKENSNEIGLVKLNLVKKGIERKEAIEGLKDIRKKESTVRFSLLFDIEWPETHGMPKEIDLLLKLPKIDNDIKKLKAKYVYSQQKVSYETAVLYYEVLSVQTEVTYYEDRLLKLNDEYDTLHRQYLMGKATMEDDTLLAETITTEENALMDALQKLSQKKAKLSELTGFDIDQNYILEEQPIELSMSRSDLETLVTYGLANDYQVFSATQDRMLSEKSVTEIYEVYKDAFGSKANVLSSYIKQDKIDYADLLSDYQNMLDKIDEKWRKVYVINMLFFKIKIPMRWFQGEYTALRYFEDEKYPLIVALGERDEMRVTEADMIAATEAKIRDSYEAVVQMQRAIGNLDDQIETAQTIYEQMITDNLKGNVAYADVLAQKDNIMALTLSKYQQQISLWQFIITLDFNTSGGIKILTGSDVYGGITLDNGVSLVEDSGDTSAASWYVSYPYESYVFIFGVNVPETLGISHYQLLTSDDVALSGKLKVTETFSHLPLTFTDQTQLKVKFYQGETLVYESTIEGDTNEGTLALIPVAIEKPAVGEIVGAYQIDTMDILRSQLTLTMGKSLEVKNYQIVTLDDEAISDVLKVEAPYISLATTLSDVTKLKINLMDQDEQVIGTVIMESRSDKQGQLIWKEAME